MWYARPGSPRRYKYSGARAWGAPDTANVEVCAPGAPQTLQTQWYSRRVAVPVVHVLGAPDATNTAEVFSGSAGDVSFGAADFSGTVTTTSDLVIDNNYLYSTFNAKP